MFSKKSILTAEDTPKLLLAVVFTNLVGVSSGFLSGTANSEWFNMLEKPFLNPPSWVFGPVWTLLYTLMGVAAYLIWKQYKKKKHRDAARKALMLFVAQLVLNFFWTIIFFGVQNIQWALFEIVVLWVLILLTIQAFWPIVRIAAWLMVPYLLWVSFATYLNLSFLLLN